MTLPASVSASITTRPEPAIARKQVRLETTGRAVVFIRQLDANRKDCFENAFMLNKLCRSRMAALIGRVLQLIRRSLDRSTPIFSVTYKAD
jgi:hypothetical protein